MNIYIHRSIMDDVGESLCHLLRFSLSLKKSVLPTEWKKAKVIPVPNTTEAKKIQDFRPVTIFPIL